MFNLLNTAALAEQNSFWPTHSLTSSAGCDGEVMMINRANLLWVPLKLINSEVDATPSAP